MEEDFKETDIIVEDMIEFIIDYDKDLSIFYENDIWYAYYIDSNDAENQEIIEDKDYNIFNHDDKKYEKVILDNGYELTKKFFLDLKNRTTNIE